MGTFGGSAHDDGRTVGQTNRTVDYSIQIYDKPYTNMGLVAFSLENRGSGYLVLCNFDSNPRTDFNLVIIFNL